MGNNRSMDMPVILLCCLFVGAGLRMEQTGPGGGHWVTQLIIAFCVGVIRRRLRGLIIPVDELAPNAKEHVMSAIRSTERGVLSTRLTFCGYLAILSGALLPPLTAQQAALYPFSNARSATVLGIVVIAVSFLRDLRRTLRSLLGSASWVPEAPHSEPQQTDGEGLDCAV